MEKHKLYERAVSAGISIAEALAPFLAMSEEMRNQFTEEIEFMLDAQKDIDFLMDNLTPNQPNQIRRRK